ncbi:unnamed protein product [Urochloa decumbens]|uniref:Alpha/beta hydrolase fold-3 domain-containing protein n=1 Tax=Urochloa decumbens TaxID=240449 RepID=A0ABC9FT14_9POAL
MESPADEVAIESPAHFRLYKRDEATGVSSKDVVLDAETGLSVRLYLPKLQDPSKKLPFLVYFHGGGFMIESACSATYHNYVNPLAAAARGVLVVSVSYHLTPEPAPSGLRRLLGRAPVGGVGAGRVDRGAWRRVAPAGANIVHDMLLSVKLMEGEPEVAAAITAGLWVYACPGAVGGVDDPRMNPLAPGAPALEKLGCARLMAVCAGSKDGLCARGRAYYEAVAGSAWPGSAAWLQSEGEEHVFFLPKPECERTPSSSWTASWLS